ncbi:response regulator [Marispirochaeta sp.]|jgi:two-component system, response regulator YesN|uniref:response regulator n=1 Tax=Marispirochaeta sp. TaxID=2038653 RepID=UPI0029C726C3|nr:response regulator [Marispirochaeta sp.]
MYRLILVDDEAIIRDGISTCLPWDTNGFMLAGMFENGQQALEYLKNNHVDVVISDINMPRMDGLELSGHISRSFPETEVIILTGFDDFEYAQEAVKYQVRDFLLKPITAAELGTVLETVKKELDEKKEARALQEQMKEKLEQSFPLLRERFLYRLATGRLEPEIIRRRKEYFQWNDLGCFYQILMLEIPASWSELERVALAESVRAELQDYDELFTDQEENLVLLLQEKDEDSMALKAREIARGAYREVSRLRKDQIAAGCGRIVQTLSDLPDSFTGARNALDYSQVLGLSQIVFIDEVRNRKTISPEGFTLLSGRILDQLKAGGERQTREAVEELFRYMESHYLTMNEAAYYFIRLHSILLYFLQEMDLSLDDQSLIAYQPSSFHSLRDAQGFFDRMIGEIEGSIRARRHEMMISRVEKAKKIIAEEYADPTFSLTRMCDKLYLSTSQFSVLFKEGTGQTFVEYLTSCRINAAKQLLKTTDLKSYEIAECTGYTDPRYFSLLFRRHTNMTPMEYRKSLEQ